VGEGFGCIVDVGFVWLNSCCCEKNYSFDVLGYNGTAKLVVDEGCLSFAFQSKPFSADKGLGKSRDSR